MPADSINIFWFRQDLRLTDNPALRAAARSGQILPLYILDDVNAGDWAMGAASRAWLHRSLDDLNRSLGGRLQLFRGDAGEILASLCEALPVKGVFQNRCFEPWRISRDARIESELALRGVSMRTIAFGY